MDDKTEIIRALRLWFQPGDVFELRVLDAVTADYQRPHVESGYFEYKNIEAIPAALQKLRCYRGAYVTVNPVNPALLSRAVNRIRSVGREPTTSDTDILCRRWLLIDCDAERPSGISSTDAEHEAALVKAIEIRDGLSSLSWTAPLVIDSGNGAQLMYRVDLPANDEGLLQSCLSEIAIASDDKVKIDLTVHNPARIWRLPGTMNCKGDSTPERPHRMAKIVDAPKHLKVVMEAKLRRLIPAPVVTSATPQIYVPRGTEPSKGCNIAAHTENLPPPPTEFDLEAWIRQYAPELGSPIAWNGGRKWIFEICPFNDAHNNKSAALLEMPGGAVAFTCHHNGCADKDWRSLRELREPPKTAPVKPEPGKSGETPAVVPFPADLFNVPGLVGDVMRFSMDTAPYPNKPLAFAGALVLQSHLAARKVEAPGGARTNPYIIALAKSGTGKDHPRKINKSILCKAGHGNELLENAASGQALEDSLMLSPAILWQADEFYAVLQEASSDKTGQRESILKYLLTFFTSANTNYVPRAKVGRDPAEIINPNLTLLGSCTPGGFFGSLNERILGHGTYSRMTIFHADARGKGQFPGDTNKIPPGIDAKAKLWADFKPCGSGNLGMKTLTVPLTSSAKILLSEAQLEADIEYARLEQQEANDWKLAIWSRAFESTTRFSLIYACSEAETPEFTVITEDAVKWAKKLIWWEAANKIAMTEHHYFESDFEKYSEEVIGILLNWHKRNPLTAMPGWMFNRKTKKFPPKVRDAVVQSLVLQERIVAVAVESNGRPGITYKLIG